MSTFIEAMLGGFLVAVMLLLLWWAARRVGLARPRGRPTRRRLLCVRPLRFDA